MKCQRAELELVVIPGDPEKVATDLRVKKYVKFEIASIACPFLPPCIACSEFKSEKYLGVFRIGQESSQVDLTTNI
ncbi:unnamed protein product [Ceratitis capitata]|uniref:(Mediterranean fruit fly) hypothetical protein n=1 Tax=Ceratitis capitata TaxID=7213 RepID=A0A811UHR1_CERCA|nr:unnamed protein product [Ceratitis capitata]